MVILKNKPGKKKNPVVIHNVYIVDASGSHAVTKYNCAMEGILHEMNLLRQSTEHIVYTQTIVEFSGGGWPGDHVGYRYREESKMSHGTMKSLHDYAFVPMGPYGTTPLYKTIGEVLEDIMSRKKRKDKVLVKVVVDGKDNASKNSRFNNPAVLRHLIDDLQEGHGFTILFIGPQAGIIPIIQDIGIERGYAYIHNDTARGISQAMAATAAATLAFAKEVSRSEYAQPAKERFFFQPNPSQSLVEDGIR